MTLISEVSIIRIHVGSKYLSSIAQQSLIFGKKIHTNINDSLTVACCLYQGLSYVFQLVVSRINDHIGVQRSACDRRQLPGVDEVANPDRDHADTVHAADGRLDWRQLAENIRVAVADDDGDIWNARSVAVLPLERHAVDELQSAAGMRPVTAVRNSSNGFNDVLFDLSVVVHVESDEGVVAPVDEPYSRPVHSNVQFVDDGDDHLFDLPKPHVGDTAGAVEHEHQIHQSAASCNIPHANAIAPPIYVR